MALRYVVPSILTSELWCCLGNPVPEITWLKDGQSVLGEERLQVMSHGRFLHINDAQVVDTGRYSCLASNSAGDRSAHFNLNVLGMSVCVCLYRTVFTRYIFSSSYVMLVPNKHQHILVVFLINRKR